MAWDKPTKQDQTPTFFRNMSQSTRTSLLFFVDALLAFAILCTVSFAWILRDGLGPDAVAKTFMAFYAGPAILLLISLDLLLHRFPRGQESPRP